MTVDDRVAAFRADIAASPEALARLLDAVPPTPVDAARRLCLTGLGSSRYAADIVAAQLRDAGRTAWSELASGSARTRPAADLTVVAISASGGTPEVVEVARRHQGTSEVLAVTNRAESALSGAADQTIELRAGAESAGIACRTFRATIAALAMLTGTRPGALRHLPDALAARIPASSGWAAETADALDGAPAIDVLADAALGGLAEQAALMLREAPRLPAHAGDTADWLHVGVYLAWPGHVVLRIPGSAADVELERTLAARGVRLIDTPPIAPAGAASANAAAIGRAILASVDAELLAAELWARTTGTDNKAP